MIDRGGGWALIGCFAAILGACSSSPPSLTVASSTPALTVAATTSEPATVAATTAEPAAVSTNAPTDAFDTTTISPTLPPPTESTTTVTSPPTIQADSPNHFATLPVGSTLPGDAECAAMVRPTPEIRPANAPYNDTLGTGPQQTFNTYLARVTGNFTGTTDEIIQWTACKWGIDEDIVRAQAAKESGWFQSNRGDFTTNPSDCVPAHGIGVDGHPGECPESIGIMQTRYQYMKESFPMATDSTAYNLDVSFAIRRSCFEGNEQWLNDTDRGQEYVPGDLWGCVGVWFAGRWHTPDADTYSSAVQDYLNQRIWTSPEFLTWTPG